MEETGCDAPPPLKWFPCSVSCTPSVRSYALSILVIYMGWVRCISGAY